MHAAGKILFETYLEAIRETFFPNMSNFPICDIFCLVGHPDLPMRTTLRVVGLLTVMIFFQRKKCTAYIIKDEKEETILYFLMVFNLLKNIYPFESKKHLRTY